jgi:competence protein ComEC
LIGGAAIMYTDWQTRGKIAISVLDVGQGDSVLITTPGGTRILIDGGPGDTVLEQLAVNDSYLEQEIDMIIVTHTDADHFAGVFKVDEYYSIENIFLNLPGAQTEAKQANLGGWWEAPSQNLYAGANFEIDQVRFDVLWPEKGASMLGDGDSPNNSSVVLCVEYGDFCGIFTGDIEASVETQLVERYGAKLDCDLLKVAHHGSDSSSTPEFIQAVSPRVAIISVGVGNQYGHPSEEVITRLEQAGAVVLRTDQLGKVTLTSDGTKITWR